VKEYRAFIKQRNIVIDDPSRFIVRGIRIDIYELFSEVTSRGGYVQVCFSNYRNDLSLSLSLSLSLLITNALFSGEL
jgi:Na+-translocating ferredoxin:NAD+ oxidoreductase RnfE subunit